MKNPALLLPLIFGFVTVSCSDQENWMNDPACPATSTISSTVPTDPDLLAVCDDVGIRCRYGTLSCEDVGVFQRETLLCQNDLVQVQTNTTCPDDSSSVCAKRGDLGNNIGVGAFSGEGCLVQGNDSGGSMVVGSINSVGDSMFCTKSCQSDDECGDDATCMELPESGSFICILNSCREALGL